jgi:ferredoxin--NADP+ reductase
LEEVLDNNNHHPQHFVAVIGAGPAGLFAARELASHGSYVVIFNRDVKPGGLAEYGIYPDKRKMKEGLRNQFRQIINMENVSYFGNVVIREDGDIRLEELRALGFQSVLVTSGAQGTKWLGLPGEDLIGVYHAKDIVYHYNLLPPYSQRMYEIGKRVALVGAGNVMLDLTHYLSSTLMVDEIVSLARRGPAEIKFEKSVLEEVINILDIDRLFSEIDRLTPLMRTLNQDPDKVKSLFESTKAKSVPSGLSTHFTIEFLMSPIRILGDKGGHVNGLEVEENTLFKDNEEVKARGTGKRRVIEADSVVFAIGDKVDDWFGLPVQANEFVKNPNPKFPVEGISYEAYDPIADCELEGTFVAGWSRKASTGLVGLARKDGTNGARAVLQYLDKMPPVAEPPIKTICERLENLKKPVITQADVNRLEEVEQDLAMQYGLEEYKFSSNQEMLKAIGAI